MDWRVLCESEYFDQRTKQFFMEFKPGTTEEMFRLYVCSQNVYAWEENVDDVFDMVRFKEVLDSEAFGKCPCITREDFYEYLISKGMDKETALDISEQIRKGRAVASGYKESFEQLEIPEEVKDLAKRYWYVTSRKKCKVEWDSILKNIKNKGEVFGCPVD